MSRQKLVIWGASGHALVVADVVRQGTAYEVAGFLDDVDPGRAGGGFGGATVLGGREQLALLRASGVGHLVVAIGNCAARLRCAAMAEEAGFTLATAVHPQATLAPDARIGPGTVVCARAVINCGSRVGANVIINTAACVEHECEIGDGVHLGPGVTLGGRVSVGRAAWVGIGATVIDRIRIGEAATIGAGAVVVRDVPPEVVAYGVPARVVRRSRTGS